ncbi:chemotaxis protein MotA [Chitinivorax tropicus]|uniref:Chemotaxis protein MotA n=1 Tax=Chitinivorax tropicus TaxID=714531 RepID=A0A840MM84_9PROT|nr:flagellar motor protein [Chitinivorax tropicus]MBB5017822.1 chemotaxis protein MotA [Chitinivorax tropicus]
MQNFDKISLFGIIIAVAAIVGGQVLEGGHISSLLQITAFLIVIGGTVGAVMLQSSPSTFMTGLRLAKWIFVPPPYHPHHQLKLIIDWSQASRKGGLLALEAQISGQKDPFIQKGLQMLVDGAEPEALRHALELDINTYEEHTRRSAKVWEAAGGYAPTIGILGAVMGLIHVMENLSDPSKLGAGIAVAFVATIYGVGSANLLFLPIANKLKAHIENQVALKEMMIDGLIAIANGENPRLVESKLAGYIV